MSHRPCPLSPGPISASPYIPLDAHPWPGPFNPVPRPLHGNANINLVTFIPALSSESQAFERSSSRAVSPLLNLCFIINSTLPNPQPNPGSAPYSRPPAFSCSTQSPYLVLLLPLPIPFSPTVPPLPFQDSTILPHPNLYQTRLQPLPSRIAYFIHLNRKALGLRHCSCYSCFSGRYFALLQSSSFPLLLCAPAYLSCFPPSFHKVL